MNSSRQKETVVIRRCRNCNGQLPAPDNFCRWCGTHQSEDAVTAANKAGCCDHKTKHLRSGEEIHQSLSSMSLNTLRRNVAVKTGSLRFTRRGILVIAVLIAIPMWLLIILLSPLDAYTSARAVSSQMNVQ